MAQDDQLYLFTHIPKTGGQSLRDHFRRHLKLHEEFIHLGPFGNKDAARLNLLPFKQRPVGARQKARVIQGHAGFLARSIMLIPGGTAGDDVVGQLVRKLEGFWFVGLTETLGEDAPRLCRAMGLPDEIKRSNVAGVNYPKRLQVTDALRDLIYRTNPYDLELYRRCQASAGRYLERLPP